jgi:secreted trypsin-like serine protease
MRKILAIAALLVAFTTTPALAVTDGELDGNGHPYVGLMVAQDSSGNPLWRCSGTLISSELFLTAGHCTEAPAASVEIWFDPDMQTNSAAKGYPFTGEASGTPYTHPDYDPNAFWRYDLGLVVLDEPVNKAQYGELPKLNQLDQYKTKRGTNKAWFTAVGYGLQMSFPTKAQWKENNQKVRMVAYPKLIQINGGIVGKDSLLLSNNANTGGTCFGDSGGPNFVRDSNVIAGVTSFGMNGTCSGTGGVYRIDRQDDLNWIDTFLD